MKLIIGLGNPGKEYEKTRHNAGFLAIDHIFSPEGEGPERRGSELLHSRHREGGFSDVERINYERDRKTQEGPPSAARREPEGVWRFDKKFNAELAEIKIGKEKVVLAKPQTFMNKSGDAVGKLARFYKIKPADIIVIHDELDLPLGTLRLKIGGSSAGHKGLESVIKALKTEEFARIRIGIAPASRRISAEKFVLGAISPSEIKKLKPIFESLDTVLTVIFTESLEKAMSLYNR